MAGDKSITRYNAPDGNIQATDITADDAGNLHPSTNDGGALGVASTGEWSDLFLASGGVVNFNDSDIVITHTADQLRFQSAADGYRFESGPLHLEELSTNPSNPATGHTLLYANDYDNTFPAQLTFRQSGHAPHDSQEWALPSNMGNCVLHSTQLVSAATGPIRQATIFTMGGNTDFDDTNPDTLTLTNGTVTETWTAIASGPPAAFQFVASGSIITSMQNLATAINNDSTLWKATWFDRNADPPNWEGLHSGRIGGYILIYRDVQANTVMEDRIYGDITNPARAAAFNFGNDPDYRAVGSTSADATMPSSDPVTRNFGYGSYNSLKHGEVVFTLLDRKQWFWDKFNDEWKQVGGTIGVPVAGADADYLPYIQNTTPETATFTGVIGETHLIDTSSGSFTCNLPAIASGQGRIGFYFSGTGGQLTLDPNASEQIEGKTTIKLQQGHNTIENDGTEWKLVQKSGRANTRLDATPGATENDYNPTDWGRDVTHLYLDPSSISTITGFEENGFVGMDAFLLVNEGTADIIVAHNDAGSVASNRILIEGSRSAVLEPEGVAEIFRDGTANLWRLRLPVVNSTSFSPVKRPCALATTGNITLSGEQTIDGTLTSASRVLVWQQTTASENGIYTTGAGAWTRTTDFDNATADYIEAGLEVYAASGDLYGRTRFTLVTTGAITIGSTSLEFIPEGGLARTDAQSSLVIAALTSFTGSLQRSSTIVMRDHSEIAVFFNPSDIGSNTVVDIIVLWSDDGSTIAFADDDNIQQSDFDIVNQADGSYNPKPYTARLTTAGGELATGKKVHLVFPKGGGACQIGVLGNSGTGDFDVRVQRLVS